MTGGMIWPLTDEAVSIAPARTPPYPAFFMSGIVKMPPVTTLATDDADTRPLTAEDTTATLAGPPRRWPSRANDTCIM